MASLRSPDKNERWVSALALGKIGDPEATETLLVSLEDSETNVRRAAAYALSAIDEQWRSTGFAQHYQSQLLVRLEDPTLSIGERSSVARTLDVVNPDWRTNLSPTGSSERRAQLGNADPLIREAAAEVIGEIEDAMAAKDLVAALEDSVFAVRQKAAWALGRIKAREAAHPLIPLLQDRSPKVRFAAATALGEIGSAEAVPSLIAMMGKPGALNAFGASYEDPEDPRIGATGALRKIGDAQAVPATIDLLEDVSDLIRTEAVATLGALEDRRAVEPLIHALQDLSPDVQSETTDALARLGDARALHPLIESLEHQSDPVRVVRALRTIDAQWKALQGVDGLVSKLVNQLNHPEASQRLASARTLAAIATDEATEAVRAAARQGNLPVLAGAYRYFLQEPTIDRPTANRLVDALDAYGDERMASAYLRSDHSVLNRAARSWALRRGVALISWPTEHLGEKR